MIDRIVSRPSTDKFRENWERIWGETPVDRMRDELLAGREEEIRDLLRKNRGLRRWANRLANEAISEVEKQLRQDRIDAFVEHNEELGI